MFGKLLEVGKQGNQNTSSTKLFAGLELIGKTLLTTKQWNDQFTKIQKNRNKQKSSGEDIQNGSQGRIKFSEKNVIQLGDVQMKECKLCKTSKSSEQFISMCKCTHKFCYSCINAYAISKIVSKQRVFCPQIVCGQQLKLSSSVYNSLPDKIKLQYLNNKNQFKAKQIDFKEQCSRCLRPKHQGFCHINFSSQNIIEAYKFRRCNKCLKQAEIGEGIKKIICHQCKSAFCYLCGQEWPQKDSHSCIKDQPMIQLQKQIIQEGAKQSKSSTCCSNSQNQCIINCQKCLQSCFYCKRCDFSICFGNFLLFPIRILLNVMIIVLYALMVIPTVILVIGWLFASLVTGVTYQTCELINEIEGACQFFAFLFYPIVIFGGIYRALKITSKGFCQGMEYIIGFYSRSLCQMWIVCGPKQCCF